MMCKNYKILTTLACIALICVSISCWESIIELVFYDKDLQVLPLSKASVQITEDIFGYLRDPDNATNKLEVRRFTLSNSYKTSVQIIEYGNTITSLKVAGKNGQINDIVLGFDTLDGYRSAENPYFGATIGRVANRIGGAKFTLNNITYNLTANEGRNQLHGGFFGFDKQLWTSYTDGSSVSFSYLSMNGEEGYPGDVLTTAVYELTDDNELRITYTATVTAPTPLALTNHAYFNLAGHENGNNELRGHFALINADSYTPVDEFSIPTGEIRDVEGTVYDLRTNKNLYQQFQCFAPGNNSGYDINYCINGEPGEVRLAGRVVDTFSGRILEVHTDQPGVQFYTANNLPDKFPLVGKDGARYYRHGAFCLETQNFPNAINTPSFPSPVIDPGKIYGHRVIYRFFTMA